MRLFIHYYGDVHQPLHSVSRYTNDYPEGDRGGNSFELAAKYNIRNLHALWDRVVYGQKTNLKTPLSSDDSAELTEIANRITAKYPKSSFPDVEETNPKEWAIEGNKIVKAFVYKGIQEYGSVSADY